jgi:hypothetical protein
MTPLAGPRAAILQVTSARRLGALGGALLYLAAGVSGALLAPSVVLVIFLILPLFYGITSYGLTHAPSPVRRALSRG